MSRLLSRARISLEHARIDYMRISDDDCYMDACCFHLQQATEFLLKFIVEINGLQYAENHDIRANLNILNRNSIVIPCEKEMRGLAGTLYQWETESRYKESFVAALGDIDEVFRFDEILYDFIMAELTPYEPEEKEFPDKPL